MTEQIHFDVFAERVADGAIAFPPGALRISAEDAAAALNAVLDGAAPTVHATRRAMPATGAERFAAARHERAEVWAVTGDGATLAAAVATVLYQRPPLASIDGETGRFAAAPAVSIDPCLYRDAAEFWAMLPTLPESQRAHVLAVARALHGAEVTFGG